jgi:mRNA interferase RelE/StbE
VAKYRVALASSAGKELGKLPSPLMARMVTHIEGLASNPRPSGCRKLRGGDCEWRLRVGHWRVVYTIDDGKSLVEVTRIRHRSDVYKR